MSGYYAALEKLKSGGKIGNPLDYILPDEWKPAVRDVMLDTIPVTSQQRALARINQSGKEFADADNPISKALRAVDIGIEGAGLASDFIPGLKAAGIAGTSLLPLMMRGRKGLNAGKFRQAGNIGGDIAEANRLQRAKEAGFDINDVYHTGSNQELTYFDDTKLGAVTGDTPAGRFMSQAGHFGTKDIDQAQRYAKNAVEKRGGIESITNFVVTKDGQGVIDMADHDLNPAELAGFLLDQKDAGARSFIVKNVKDTINGAPTDIVVVMDRTAARSPNAKFMDFSSDSFTAALSGVGLGLPLALSTTRESDNEI